MASPPGTRTAETFDAAGNSCKVTLFFDETTGVIHDDPTQACALWCVNNIATPIKAIISDATTSFTTTVPTGTTKITAAQIAAHGYTDQSQLSFGITG